MTKLAILVFSVLSVAACTTPYVSIPYDREIAEIETIIIDTDVLPDRATALKLATNGGNLLSAAEALMPPALPLVAFLVIPTEANIQATQENKINTALESQGFDAEAVFDAALEAALTEAGYTLSSEELVRKSALALADISADPEAKGTAVLDITGVSYGYQLVGGNTQWRPYMTTIVRLTDKVDPTNILMDNRVVYNPVAQPEVIVTIQPSEDMFFDTMDEIEANPEKVAAYLEAAIIETANTVALLLK